MVNDMYINSNCSNCLTVGTKLYFKPSFLNENEKHFIRETYGVTMHKVYSSRSLKTTILIECDLKVVTKNTLIYVFVSNNLRTKIY